MRRRLEALLLLASLAISSRAFAQDQDSDHSVPRLGPRPASRKRRALRLFGVQPAQSKEMVLDFHGYLLLPMELGVHDRLNPQPGQSEQLLHTPPLIPQFQEGFEYTGVIPTPWVQLDFIYGNSTVSATTILAATTLADAAGYYDTTAQLGVSDAFITVNATKQVGFPFEVHVGAMTGRYGRNGRVRRGPVRHAAHCAAPTPSEKRWTR